MKTSLNELEAMVRKAARGAGWVPSLAMEAGKAAAWLSAVGLDGPKAALDALNQGPRKTLAKRQGDIWDFDKASVISSGPSMFDLLEVSPEAKVTLTHADQTPFLLGYAGVAAIIHQTRYQIVSGDQMYQVTAAGTGQETSTTTQAMTIITRCANAPDIQPTRTDAVNVDELVWSRLAALAAKSYVPATDASRLKGAGAGLTDND